MAGVLPGEAKDAGRLVRFGYAALSADSDSMLFRAGESFPIHEFHHWGFHRQRHGPRGKKAGGRRSVAVRVCKRAFLCGLPAFVLGGYAPAAALCRRG